ncbi:TIGR03757 family integrating conjugative element protein [Thioalkalivibrio denitrificans]|nr:TIGR03757 family integrating conjugative element protein [Thioalkalivibrio denitrificans]
MRNAIAGLVLVMVLSSLSAPVLGQGHVSVEVFTTPHYRVTGIGRAQRALAVGEVQVYDLSAAMRLENSLSDGLPSDQAEAASIAAHRIRNLDAKQLQQAFGGLVRASALRLDRIPAVVIDGHAVVYGVTDVVEAYGHYRRWRGD